MGADIAWVFQPFLAFCGAAVGLGVYALIEPLVSSVRVRALVAFLSSQSALLYGYSLWGGVKELASAFLLVLMVALAAAVIARRPTSVRGFIPLGVAAGALIQALGIGAAAWVGLTLGAVAVFWLVSEWNREELGKRIAWIVALGVVAAACMVPVWLVPRRTPLHRLRPLLERPVRTDQTRKPDRAAERLPIGGDLAGGRISQLSPPMPDHSPDRTGSDRSHRRALGRPPSACLWTGAVPRGGAGRLRLHLPARRHPLGDREDAGDLPPRRCWRPG